MTRLVVIGWSAQKALLAGIQSETTRPTSAIKTIPIGQMLPTHQENRDGVGCCHASEDESNSSWMRTSKEVLLFVAIIQ